MNKKNLKAIWSKLKRSIFCHFLCASSMKSGSMKGSQGKTGAQWHLPPKNRGNSPWGSACEIERLTLDLSACLRIVPIRRPKYWPRQDPLLVRPPPPLLSLRKIVRQCTELSTIFWQIHPFIFSAHRPSRVRFEKKVRRDKKTLNWSINGCKEKSEIRSFARVKVSFHSGWIK